MSRHYDVYQPQEEPVSASLDHQSPKYTLHLWIKNRICGFKCIASQMAATSFQEPMTYSLHNKRLHYKMMLTKKYWEKIIIIVQPNRMYLNSCVIVQDIFSMLVIVYKADVTLLTFRKANLENEKGC